MDNDKVIAFLFRNKQVQDRIKQKSCKSKTEKKIRISRK